ncbi:MAG: iron ABC transporter substrate-binding protein [Myxococcota bacterium]
MSQTHRLSFALIAVLLLGVACNSGNGDTTPPAQSDGPDKGKGSTAADSKPTGDAPKEKEVTLTIYSGRKEKLVQPVFDLFQEETGIKVRVKYGQTQPLATALIKEGERTEADIFVAQDASTLGFLESKDQLAQLPEDLRNRVVENFRVNTSQWIPVTGRARVLAYSTKLKPEDLPKSVDALTDPAWKGRIGWPPENASFKSFVSAMAKLRGPEKTTAWLKGVQANAPKTYPKNTPAVRAVGKGEIDVALVNHYYLYRLKAELGEDFPVKNHYFKDGSSAALVNISGAGIVKASAHQEAALKFVRFLLSDKAQQHFAETNYEFPLVPGVKAKLDLPPVEELQPPKVDLTALDNVEETEKLLREAGVMP